MYKFLFINPEADGIVILTKEVPQENLVRAIEEYGGGAIRLGLKYIIRDSQGNTIDSASSLLEKI